MTKRPFILAIAGLTTLMTLSACDGGSSSSSSGARQWQAIKYTGGVYSEERTAGMGIKWVLAAMAPKKGPMLEPIMAETKALPVIEAPVKVSTPPPFLMPQGMGSEPKIRSATPIFIEKNRK